MSVVEQTEYVAGMPQCWTARGGQTGYVEDVAVLDCSLHLKKFMLKSTARATERAGRGRTPRCCAAQAGRGSVGLRGQRARLHCTIAASVELRRGEGAGAEWGTQTHRHATRIPRRPPYQ